MADLLKSKGLDPIVADLVPKDVEATPDALEAWYGKYGKAFAPASAGNGEGASEEGEQSDSASATTVPEEEQDALSELMSLAVARATPAAAADMQRKLQNAGSMEELLALTQSEQTGAPRPLFG